MVRSADGRWQLTESDLEIGPDCLEVELDVKDGSVYAKAYLTSLFDVDYRLGTETYGTNSYISLFAEYDVSNDGMRLTYVIHRPDGSVSKELETYCLGAEKATVVSLMRKSGLGEEEAILRDWWLTHD